MTCSAKRFSSAVMVSVFVLLLCSAGEALAATWEKSTIRVGDVEREYYVFVPDSAASPGERPAVIALHGFESDANGLRWLTRSDSIAERHGMVMVYPNAQNKSWNAGKGFGSKNKTSDDIGFMRALVAELPARHGLDEKRLFAMGFSNGGQLAAMMACELADRVAAVGIVAQTMNIDGCEPAEDVPVALIHGAKDPLAPFDGGGPFELRSHADSVALFRSLNETPEATEVVLDASSIRCKSFGKGSKSEVIDCVAFEDGHTWPGGVEFKVDLFGTVNQDMHATDFLFDFFSRHRLSQGTGALPNEVAPETEETEMPLPRRGFQPPPTSLALDIEIQQHCDESSRSRFP